MLFSAEKSVCITMKGPTCLRVADDCSGESSADPQRLGVVEISSRAAAPSTHSPADTRQFAVVGWLELRPTYETRVEDALEHDESAYLVQACQPLQFFGRCRP